MSETYTVLALSVFIGALAFMSISAVDSIPELENITATEEYRDFEYSTSNIDIDDYIKAVSVEKESGSYVYNGTLNDRGTSYGYLQYNITGIEDLTFVVDAGYLNRVTVVYYDDNMSTLAADSTTMSTISYNRQDFIDENGEAAAVAEIQIGQGNALNEIRIGAETQGLIDKAQGVISIFSSLSSNTVWFNLIVAVPFSIVSIWLLALIVSRLLPLSG